MIGERIRTARESAGLSQAELAERAGTTQQTVDRIERGETEFSRSTAPIMAALGMHADDRGTHQTALQQRIRERLSALHLSANGASERAGLSRDAVRMILDGRSQSPRYDTMKRLAEVLECTPEWLAGDDASDEAASSTNERVAVFRERLAKRRDERGFNDYSLALAMGANESYVRDILRGKVKEPTVWKLFDLAQTLDCSPQWLLGLDSAAPPPSASPASDGDILRQAAAVLRSYGRDATAKELDDLAQIIARAQERAKA